MSKRGARDDLRLRISHGSGRWQSGGSEKLLLDGGIGTAVSTRVDSGEVDAVEALIQRVRNSVNAAAGRSKGGHAPIQRETTVS